MNIFKKAQAKQSLDKYSALNKAAVSWRAVAIFEALAIIVLSVGLTLLSNSREIVPWVVQVDKHNFAIAAGPAERANTADPRLVIARLSQFVEGLKSITADPTAQGWLIKRLVYSSLADSSPALNTTNQFYRANNPFKRYKDKRETVSVEVRTILPMGANSWRAEWTEHIFVDGLVVRDENWSGVFEVGVSAPTDIEKIKDNPLGIFVVSYSMNKDFR